MTGGAGASSCTAWPTSRGAEVLVAGPPYCQRLAVSTRANTATLRPVPWEAALWLTNCSTQFQGCTTQHEQVRQAGPKLVLFFAPQ